MLEIAQAEQRPQRSPAEYDVALDFSAASRTFVDPAASQLEVRVSTPMPNEVHIEAILHGSLAE